MKNNKKVRFFAHCCFAITVFHVPGATAQETKANVCHIPPGNPENVHTIAISVNALAAHLEHGDSIGACDPQPIDASVAVAEVPQVDVCHVPPENPDNVHTITISQNVVCTHLDHGDNIGACDPDMLITLRKEAAPAPDPVAAPAACACPKAGVWRVTNLDGWMECNVLNIKRPLKGKGKNDGAIWILNDDCSSTFLEAYEKERENVLMERGRDCLYFGFAAGEEDGADALFDGAYRLETEEFATGEFYLEMTGDGINCSGHRPFEMEFIEPISEKKYDKLEAEMQEQLGEAREVLEENRELIEEYLEETDGGRALGGRNAQE